MACIKKYSLQLTELGSHLSYKHSTFNLLSKKVTSLIFIATFRFFFFLGLSWSASFLLLKQYLLVLRNTTRTLYKRFRCIHPYKFVLFQDYRRTAFLEADLQCSNAIQSIEKKLRAACQLPGVKLDYLIQVVPLSYCGMHRYMKLS